MVVNNDLTNYEGPEGTLAGDRDIDIRQFPRNLGKGWGTQYRHMTTTLSKELQCCLPNMAQYYLFSLGVIYYSYYRLLTHKSGTRE